MKTTRIHWPAIALGCLLAASGCAPAASSTAPGTVTPAAGDDFEAIYRARRDSARMRFTEADVRFMSNMIHHHAQAIEISKLVPARTADASIKILASRIINAQQDEIAIMEQWLRDRDQPVPERHEGHHNAAHMPGMLTAEQVQQLEHARGAAFDRLFLELMIQHHQGAVSMVHELFATDGAGQDEAVFKFASDVQVDQSTEVARMERMLAAMPAAQ